MTSYISEIVVGSVIGATLGVAAYTVVQPRPTPMQQAASDIHARAWGKPWPQSEGTIDKTEISDETGSVDDDENYGLADKLVVPLKFNYRYFKEIRSLKSVLAADPGPGIEDILLIREEYEVLRQALVNPEDFKKSVVVTGHPGIGKSTFLLYLLLYRLEKKLPTAVQFGAQHYFIFDEKGAAVNPLSSFDSRLGQCWALADSNNKILEPCEPFQDLAQLVILASSPKPERWREWIKQAKGRRIISDLPSVPEIAAIAKEGMELSKQLGEQPLYDPSSTLSLVRKWGPSIRNILRSMEFAARGRVDPIEDDTATAVDRICNNSSSIFEKTSRRMPQSEGSSVIFLRRTGNGNMELDEALTFIPTPHLLTMFEEQRRYKKNSEFLEVFYALSSHALTRGVAGWAHEKSVHNRLGTSGAELSISQGPTKKSMWPSTHLLPGTLAGLKDAGANDSFYWIPSMANFPGIDGVLGNRDGNRGGHIYTIQATIASHHKSPLEGIKKVWERIGPVIRTTHTWHFVIITDTKEAVDAYEGQFSSELSKLRLGEAQVGVQFWTCALRS